jgi:hypothetical protein
MLTSEDLGQISALLKDMTVQGTRYAEQGMKAIDR